MHALLLSNTFITSHVLEKFLVGDVSIPTKEKIVRHKKLSEHKDNFDV